MFFVFMDTAYLAKHAAATAKGVNRSVSTIGAFSHYVGVFG
jgi:hypothetical protein